MNEIVYQKVIPINPVTKKNQQQIFKGKNGRPFIMPSKKYKQYSEQAGYFLRPLKSPINFPVNLKCVFYRKTRHKVDLSNLIEAIQDVLVECGVIEDDNYEIIKSLDGSRVVVGSPDPRTEIIITKLD